MAGLSALAEAQAGRSALLGPIALISGAAWRLAPVAGPPTALLGLISVLAALVAFVLARPMRVQRGALSLGSAGLAFMLSLAAWAGLGGLAVDLRLALAAAPRLEQQIGPVVVTGWVVAVEPGQTRPRMRLRVHSIEGVPRPPIYVQLSPPLGSVLPPGRAARCLAVLAPPALPLFPGAYDPARRAYFTQIGAAGYTLGTCRPIALAKPALPLQALLWLQAVRRDMAESVADAAPGLGGALAAAVLLGDRTLLDASSNAAFQNSGLAHLLSVSGLHMSLAAGLAFAVFYSCLALVPTLALRWPLKKVAAGAALICALAYMVFTGSSVPAQRAFIMTGAALGAVLLDRPAFTMRALATAAVCVVLLAPESVLDAGFQMSFAATAALVAFFEARTAQHAALPSPGPVIGALQGLWEALRVSLLISLVAGLATDPIAAFHFQRITLYGLAANLAAAPLMSFLVAPAAMLALLTTPLGWDGPLQAAAWGLELIGGVGAAFGQRPEAIRAIPAMPQASFTLFLIAIGWLCIWRGAVRWLGLAFAAAALWIYAAAAQPILLMDSEAKVALARTAQSWAIQRAPRATRFAEQRLGQRAGLNVAQIARLPDLACAPHGCHWRTRFGHMAGLALSALGEAQLCGRVDLLISLPSPASGGRGGCATGVVITAADLHRQGGLAIYETRRGFRVRHALDGRRPIWHPSPQP